MSLNWPLEACKLIGRKLLHNDSAIRSERYLSAQIFLQTRVFNKEEDKVIVIIFTNSTLCISHINASVGIAEPEYSVLSRSRFLLRMLLQ